MKILTFVVTFLVGLLFWVPPSQAVRIAEEGDTGTGDSVKSQVKSFIIHGVSKKKNAASTI